MRLNAESSSSVSASVFRTLVVHASFVMPANLTQQYLKAEQAYRSAATPDEELQCLQVMLRELPKHKGTDKLQAELKRKISATKTELQKGKPRKGPSFKIPRQGAGRAVLIGPPNSGKSSLLKALTRAEPEVAPYPFTTREPAPGMMPFEDVYVQLIDTPPITTDVLDPNTQALIRGADLALLVANMGSDDGIEQLQEVLDKLNATKTRLDAESRLSESDVGVSYTATILVLNQSDDPEFADRVSMLDEFVSFNAAARIEVSATRGDQLEQLKQRIYESLDVVRVYTKMPSRREADFEKPFTVRRGGTLLDVAALIHQDLAANFKFAKVWGEQVHDGAVMKGDYVVRDKDIVEIHA